MVCLPISAPPLTPVTGVKKAIPGAIVSGFAVVKSTVVDAIAINLFGKSFEIMGKS